MILRRFCLLLSCFGTTSHAYADDFYMRSSQDVKQQMALGDYAPLGITAPAGSIFYPSVTLSETFDDNIYRRQNKVSDFVTSVRPAAALQSDWTRHSLRLSAAGDFGFHADNQSENYEDYRFDTDGKLDILHQTYLTGGFHYARLHDDRGSPNDTRGDQPTEFNRTGVNIGFARELARLKLTTEARFDDWRYDDNSLNGVLIDNQYRNRQQESYQAKLAYELVPGYDAFARYTYRVRSYDVLTVDKSDSTGHDFVVGTALSLTGTLEGEVYAGYFTQDYARNYDSIHYTNYGAALNWGITPLTALRVDIHRDVLPTNIIGASDYTETSYSVGMVQALRQNISADITFRYTKDEFVVGTGLNGQKDTLTGIGVGLDYLLNRNLSVRTSYNYLDRDSSNVSSRFDNNLFSIALKVAY